MLEMPVSESRRRKVLQRVWEGTGTCLPAVRNSAGNCFFTGFIQCGKPAIAWTMPAWRWKRPSYLMLLSKNVPFSGARSLMRVRLNNVALLPTLSFGEMHMRRSSLLLAIVLFSWGCAQVPRDIRSALLTAARAGDPDFPDGKSVQSTHFSHVCEIITDNSERIYVADHRTVLSGMASPRGMNYILFFDGELRFLGKLRYSSSRPLWCNEGKLYLFGDLDGDPDLSGNVVDLSGGYERLRIYHESVYGSSGGIYD